MRVMVTVVDPESVARELAKDLPSPYCPGRTISSCPSGQARQLEQKILQLAESGRSRDEIEAILVDRFGAEIMGTPMRTELVIGVSLAGLLLLCFLVQRAWRWRHGRNFGEVQSSSHEGTSATDQAPNEHELEQLEDALEDIREF